MNEKEQVAASIKRAQADLEQALADLDEVPAFDPGVVTFAAHALSNYLTVSGGTVDLLLLSLREYPDPQVRAWIEGLGHATELMRHTVSQLMTSSAPNDPKLRFLKWELLPLVQRACDHFRRFADPKQIVMECFGQTDIRPVWTDPVAVAAVLDNLVSNAIKYSPPGKHIWVEVRAEDAGAVCSVRDEGPGLSPEDQAKLFQRGVRLTPVPTAGEPSSGYGLAVAKDLVDRLGGQLWVTTSEGQGACFSFRLPYASG
jgi:signal transduction histidine kinase